MTDIEVNIDLLYDNLLFIIRGEEITTHNWIILVRSTMELVEDVKELKDGKDKLKVSLLLIKKVIEEHVKNEKDREILLDWMDNTIPQAIEVIILASKHVFNLNKTKIRKWFKCCC